MTTVANILISLKHGSITQAQAAAEIEELIELGTVQLRDTFAGQALQGICAHHDTWGEDILGVVARSWELANEMLKARQQLCTKSQTLAHYAEQALLAKQEGGAV